MSKDESEFHPDCSAARQDPSDVAPVVADQDTFPEVIGEYALIDRIDGGGFGVVFKAMHVISGKPVAIKILRKHLAEVPTILQRFKSEAVIAGRLQHDHIVRLYRLGAIDGFHFLVMNYVAGVNLRRYASARPLPPNRCAEIILQAATACHYAHTRRKPVVHRDIKPANILIEAATSRVLLTDFGLAKELAQPVDWTRSEQALGTVHYMAPEQLDPQLGPTSAASDIYSLGATLYELMTGRPPFPTPGEQVIESLEHQILWEPPVKPVKIISETPRELQTICLKCLEKLPWNRYPTAAALAQDLERFLNHQPIVARLPGPLKRYRDLWRRRPAVAASLTALLITFAGGSVATGLYRHKAILNAAERDSKTRQITVVQQDASRHAKEAARQSAIATRQTALATQRAAEVGQQIDARKWQEYVADMSLLPELWNAADLTRVREILARNTPQVPADEDRRGIEWYYWSWRLAQNDLRFHVTSNGCRSIAMTAGAGRVAVSNHDTVEVWDPHLDRLLFKQSIPGRRSHDAIVSAQNSSDQSVAFSPDGTMVATTCRVRKGAASLGFLSVLNITSGNLIFHVQDDPELGGEAVVFSPDGTKVLAGGYNNAWLAYDVRTGVPWTPPRRLVSPFPRVPPSTSTHAPVKSLQFTNNNRLLVSCSDSLTPYVWSWPDGQINAYLSLPWQKIVAGQAGCILSAEPHPLMARLDQGQAVLVVPPNLAAAARLETVRQLDPHAFLFDAGGLAK